MASISIARILWQVGLDLSFVFENSIFVLGEGEEAQVEYADGTYDETEYYEQEPITKKKGFFVSQCSAIKTTLFNVFLF